MTRLELCLPKPGLTFGPLHQGVDDGHIAVSANAEGHMVGVAIAEIHSTPGTSRLKSLLVQEAYRHRGTAQGLLASLEERVRAHGGRRIEVTYAGGTNSADVFTHILSKGGWDLGVEPVLIFTASAQIVDASWMRVRAARECELFAWPELTAQERNELAAARHSSRWFPDGLGPFPEQPAEPVCSVGARYRGRVVGWMLAHRVDVRTVRYSRLFVRREFRRQACGVMLFAEALRRQHAAGIPASICAVSSENAAMLRIMKRRVEPYLDSKTTVCFGAKDLLAH